MSSLRAVFNERLKNRARSSKYRKIVRMQTAIAHGTITVT